jgi:hypothetical protein
MNFAERPELGSYARRAAYHVNAGLTIGEAHFNFTYGTPQTFESLSQSPWWEVVDHPCQLLDCGTASIAANLRTFTTDAKVVVGVANTRSGRRGVDQVLLVHAIGRS